MSPWSVEHRLTERTETEPEAISNVVWRVEGHRHSCGRATDTCTFSDHVVSVRCKANNISQILASARLQILENPFSSKVEEVKKRMRPLYAGQPISALLTVNTSFHWAPPEDVKVQSYNMRYDIEDLTQDWLVSGRKRGDFVAKVSFTPMAAAPC